MDRNFSREFGYALWTPNTEITLANVPWSNSLDKIAGFGTRAELDSYINGTPNARTIRFANTARVNEPIVIDELIADVMGYNFVRATNNVQSAILGDKRTSYYYFILGARSTASHTTELQLQLDAWSTFFTEVKFGMCYVEQGHLGVAAENGFNGNGRNFLTVPEGLDYGSEYVVAYTGRLAGINPAHAVLVGSTIDLTADLGSSEKTAKMPAAKGSRISGLVSGVSYYVFNSYNSLLKGLLSNLSSRPWAATGIVSISAIPTLGGWVPGWNEKQPINAPNSVLANAAYAPPEESVPLRTFNVLQNWRTEVDRFIPAKYRHFKKLLTYPYCVIEMTSYQGSPVMLKPENMGGNDLKFYGSLTILPPGQRITYYPASYNVSDEDNFSVEPYRGDFLDQSVSITNFPQFSTVNNNSAIALASQSASIGYARTAVDWAQQRTLEANRVSYDQAGSVSNLSSSMNDVANAAITRSREIGDSQSIQSAWAGSSQSLLGLDIGGAAMTGINTAIASNHANQQAAADIYSNNRSDALSGTNSEYMRDTNKTLADWGARGDHASQVAAIDAKVHDMQFVTPSVVTQAGGELAMLSHYGLEMRAIVKFIDAGAMRRVCEHWTRYGYQVHQRHNMSKLHVMSHFTYWKLHEVNLVGTNIPEGYKNIISGLFEKGVTVYKDPNDIGTIDPWINTPVSGVRL